MPAGGRVFLTGGTGGVGSHVAERMRAAGCAVRALHRPGSDPSFLRALGCELREGDLHERPETLARAMEGCDALVHCAALVYHDLPWEAVRAVNAEGTRRVFRAGVAAGIRRAVHLSSVAVLGGEAGPVDEDDPLEAPLPERARYARSKREAERAVAEAVHGSGMGVAVLRPSVVYGERDRIFVPRLVRVLDLPVHPLPGGGRVPMAALYAGNLAEAVRCALATEGAPGCRPYLLGGDHPLSARTLLRALAEALGRPFRPLPVPGAILLPAAWMAERLGRGLPGGGDLSPLRAARLALRPNPWGAERARKELGWRPPVPLDEAIRRTAAWVARGAQSVATKEPKVL